MKRTAFFIVIIVIGFVFQTCKQESNTLKVGYMPIAECLPLYVAKEKGLFEKYGLNVELVSESGGPSVFRELGAESIDVGFSNVVTLIKTNNGGGGPYKSIFGATYETFQNINHAIIARNGSKLISDSKARFIVNARNNIEELMLLKYLRNLKVMPSNVLLSNITEVPFTQMLSYLRANQADYACIVEPTITLAKNDTTAFKMIGNTYLTPLTPETDTVIVATYVALNSTISSRKKSINNFILAMEEATKYINENLPASRDYIKKYSNIDENLLPRISLPLFTNTINKNKLSEIIDLMYDPNLNISKSFITKPTNIIKPEDLIYAHE